MAYDETIDGSALKQCMPSAQFNTLEAAEMYETPEYKAYNCSTCGLYHLHEIEEEQYMNTTALREIADTLRKMQEKYPEGIVDMNEMSVRDSDQDVGTHECGTIHCFAGWYGVAHPELYDENKASKLLRGGRVN